MLELPRGLTPAELAGGFGLPRTQALSGQIEESFQRRLARLPAKTQQLLLLAAAEPVGDSPLVWRAADLLGIGIEAKDAAESEGLLEFGAPMTFRHPLVRSAIYRAASPPERREVHRALAEVTDPRLDPDRRAWHRAQASAGPDDDVASELERSAGRAQARGGLAAAAAFLERSAALTVDPASRAKRALAAANAKYEAGAFGEALGLLARAAAGPLEELDSARADLLRGQIAFASSRGSDAPPLLLKAAKRLELLDVELARQTYLEAIQSAMYAGRLATSVGVPEAAAAARAAPSASQPPVASDLLLDGFALLVTEGYAAAATALKQSLSAFASEDISSEDAVRWLWLACPAALLLWDDESWYALSSRHVQLARDSGALSVLPMALSQLAGLCVFAGDFAAATCLNDEAEAVTDAVGSELPPYGLVGLAVFRGREPQTSELIKSSTGDLVRRGEGVGLTFIEWATAVLDNGLGRYEDALVAAQRACDDANNIFARWAALELIEAAARSGVPERAAVAFDQLLDSTRASGTEWARGVDSLARALLSDGETAEPLYREALDHLRHTRVRLTLARAHLLYGEWLRRERQRTDARVQLRTAFEMFITIGAEGFAERARRELLATGETVRKRAVETSFELTAQEAQVTRLAREGLSNADIGARLFISPRTVQYHLRKVFAKFGISSRTQLDQVLSSDPNERHVGLTSD
jgi:DNA-binding CsgD family transcriptional regulator